VAVFCPIPGSLANSLTRRAKDGMESNMKVSENPILKRDYTYLRPYNGLTS
jgi:hypothetical protein